MNSIKFLAPRDSVLSRCEEIISQLKAMLPRGSLDPEMDDMLSRIVDIAGRNSVKIEKRDLMRHQYSADELNQQMAVRSAFDAEWLLNPSKVFPLEGRAI